MDAHYNKDKTYQYRMFMAASHYPNTGGRPFNHLEQLAQFLQEAGTDGFSLVSSTPILSAEGGEVAKTVAILYIMQKSITPSQ